MYINNPGHMTKMTAMPIYGKTPKKSSMEQVVRFIETWHVALVIRVLL